MHPMGRKTEDFVLKFLSSSFFGFSNFFSLGAFLSSSSDILVLWFSMFICFLLKERGSPKRLDGWKRLPIFGYDSLFG